MGVSAVYQLRDTLNLQAAVGTLSPQTLAANVARLCQRWAVDFLRVQEFSIAIAWASYASAPCAQATE